MLLLHRYKMYQKHLTYHRTSIAIDLEKNGAETNISNIIVKCYYHGYMDFNRKRNMENNSLSLINIGNNIEVLIVRLHMVFFEGI